MKLSPHSVSFPFFAMGVPKCPSPQQHCPQTPPCCFPPKDKPTNDLIVHLAASSDRVTFSFLRALNFFRQSTVSCLCMHEATVARCWGERELPQSSSGGKGPPAWLSHAHTRV